VFEMADHRYDRRVRRIAGQDSGVRFHGYVPDDDLATLLHAVGASALPNRRSTQSGIAGLALAAGLPVVTSDLEELTAALGASALVLPGGDPSTTGRGAAPVEQ
jgi:glycosyltransferase involved in cell wall biosynthesis